MQHDCPDRQTAEALLAAAEAQNPGPWGDHSRMAARCAERIAGACGMDPERAYILGLLHDIGRAHGFSYFRHAADGYRDMLALGYPAAARVCLTHSFSDGDLNSYIGRFDVTHEEKEEMGRVLSAMVFDDYDRLIQLCDAVCMAEGVVPMVERMTDVKQRYGMYPQSKWDGNLALQGYFEEKTGGSLAELTADLRKTD